MPSMQPAEREGRLSPIYLPCSDQTVSRLYILRRWCLAGVRAANLAMLVPKRDLFEKLRRKRCRSSLNPDKAWTKDPRAGCWDSPGRPISAPGIAASNFVTYSPIPRFSPGTHSAPSPDSLIDAIRQKYCR